MRKDMDNLDKTGFLTSTKRRSTRIKQKWNQSNDVPNAEKCTRFQGNNWGARKEHNSEAEWLKDLKRD